MATVTGLVGSSLRATLFIVVTIFAPRSVPCSRSSLPNDQMTTLG